MSNDDLAKLPVNLHGPLCKIFSNTNINVLAKEINDWIKEHPDIYLEQQETSSAYNSQHSAASIVVTIWYTEDSE